MKLHWLGGSVQRLEAIVYDLREETPTGASRGDGLRAVGVGECWLPLRLLLCGQQMSVVKVLDPDRSD